MGMSMARAVDPNSGVESTALGQYFSILLTLAFLTVGAHLQFISLLVRSYAVFPPGESWLSQTHFQQMIDFGGDMLSTAVLLALPVTLLLLLVNIVTGVISRSAPSLNLFALGLPAGQIGFVSSNGWDACCAAWFGYRTLWVNRAGEPPERLGPGPEREARGLAEVAGWVAAAL